MKQKSLYQTLCHVVDLRIPGFEKAVPPGRARQLAFADYPVKDWFEQFVNRVNGAVGKGHFPIFRVCDGEFYFCCGYKFGYRSPGSNPIKWYLGAVYDYITRRKYNTFWSGSVGYGFENYRGKEWFRLREEFAGYLREIAQDGILAVAFFQTPERFAEQYHRPMCDWLEANAIPITERNYYPFYFVYGLLNGRLRWSLLKGRKILVVTSMNPEKEKALSQGLGREDVESLQFIPISRNHAMTDKISLDGVKGSIDIALIGGGVGAANIIHQLRPLKTMCIDAGYSLDLIAEPWRAGSRDFTKPDDE